MWLCRNQNLSVKGSAGALLRSVHMIQLPVSDRGSRNTAEISAYSTVTFQHAIGSQPDL